MKIIFFGTPHYVIPILEVLLKKYDVAAIVSAPDKKGRKNTLIPSPVKTAYQQYFERTNQERNYPLNIFTPEKFEKEIIKKITLLQPNLFVIAAYGKLLPKAILDIPSFGTICIHPSLLPQYRGPSPVPFTLLAGDTITGTTIIKIDEKMDHGPILSMNSFKIHETDTYDTLMKHLFQLGADMLPDVIDNYTQGKIIPQLQDETKATFSKLLRKSDGFIDLENPPDQITLDRMIRAYYPWPAVWSKIKINNKEKLLKFLPNNMIQIEGKNPVSYKDFLNGYPELREQLRKLFYF